MSTTYTAHTVIGVKLKKQQLTANAMMRSCECVSGDPAAKYCSYCGKPMYTSKEVWRLKAMEDDQLTGNIRLVQPYHGCDDYFAGMVLSCDARWSSAHNEGWNFEHWPSDKVIQDLKVALCDLLTPFGLWDKREFGIYTFVGTS